MDLPELVHSAVSHVTPALPYLWASGKEYGKEFVKTLGGESAKKLFEWLKPKAEATPALKDAVDDLAAAPEDADAQAALRVQLKKLLQQQPTLVGELQALVQVHQETHITQNVSGDGSIVSGRDTHIGTLKQQF